VSWLLQNEVTYSMCLFKFTQWRNSSICSKWPRVIYRCWEDVETIKYIPSSRVQPSGNITAAFYLTAMSRCIRNSRNSPSVLCPRQPGFVEHKVAVHQNTVTMTPSGAAQRVTRLVKTFTLDFVRTYENALKFLKQCQAGCSEASESCAQFARFRT